MSKLYLLFFGCLIKEILSAAKCKTFKKRCIDEVKIENICYLSGNEGIGEASIYNYFYKPCSNNQFCEKITTNYGQCMDRYNNMEEGEKCSMGLECKSGICSNGKCSYILDGNICNEDMNCKKTSFCKYRASGKPICAKLSGKGEECLFDNYCQFNLACGTIDTSGVKKCAEMYSLKAGEMSDNADLCESGYFATRNGISYCVEAVVNKTTCSFEEENPCPTYLIYNETIPTEIAFGACNCKWNGDMVCKPSSNSDSWKNFIKIYRDEVSKIKGEEIHASTMRRSFWGKNEIIDARTYYSNYLEMDGAEDCVINYYLEKNRYNGNDWVKVQLSLLFIFSFII